MWAGQGYWEDWGAMAHGLQLLLRTTKMLPNEMVATGAQLHADSEATELHTFQGKLCGLPGPVGTEGSFGTGEKPWGSVSGQRCGHPRTRRGESKGRPAGRCVPGGQ